MIDIKTITVVGLGVIGGSFVKALKDQGYRVFGIDTSLDTLKKAKEEGYIEEGFIDGTKIIPQTDLTIICLYPSLVLDFIKNNSFKKGSIITDATGIKGYFIDHAIDLAGDQAIFISGHPMAGREKKGFEYSSKEVFLNANYILIDHRIEDRSALAYMEKLVGRLGFKSIKIMSPQDHDEVIAFTSQLPHVIAVGLINSDNQKFDTGKYIGDSYRDLTRIANINEDLWSELFLNNKDNLLKAIEQFETQLDLIKLALENDDSAKLKEYFIESSTRRQKL